jgi:hypothetical protein
MDQYPVPDASGEAVEGTRPVVRRPGEYPMGTRLLVGSIVSFVVASLLYGPTIVMQMLFFATVCTIGIGLLLILAGCWLVGWVLLEVWSSIREQGSEPSQP